MEQWLVETPSVRILVVSAAHLKTPGPSSEAILTFFQHTGLACRCAGLGVVLDPRWPEAGLHAP